MPQAREHKAQIPNPALRPLGVLVGEWEAVGTHPLVPNKTLRGRSSFKWIEGGAFLLWQSEVYAEGFPAGIAIFGSDDATGEYYMLYFDEREVSRKYDVEVSENVIKWWRNAPNFAQRYTWTIEDDGDTLIGKGELSRDNSTWESDLDLTYSRVK